MKAPLLALLLLAGCSGSMSYGAATYGPPSSPSAVTDPSPEGSTWGARAEDRGPQHTPTVTPVEQRVVYLGYLKLRVRRVLAAVDEIARLTETAGGYVQSQTASVVIVRIPASDFERVMTTFAGVGELLDRRIQAMDVTRQFTDLSARLSVAREARERLLALLAHATDVEERLLIVQEVKRLTEQIESMEATLGTLENLVAYFTITIELVPVADQRQVVQVSPFPWVRSLSAHRATLTRGGDDVDMDLPRGFVHFTEDRAFRAQAADTTTLRGAVIPNEPAGDNAFWAGALEHELAGRDEELVSRIDSGALTIRVFRNKDTEPRTWLIGVHSAGDRLAVVEAFFPTEEAWRTHQPEVTRALGSFRLKD